MTASATVTLPGLLARFADDGRSVAVAADTLAECLDHLVEAHPDLEPHLFDADGDLRDHLRLYHNGEGVDWVDVEATTLDEGDDVLVLQAVSGG